MPRLRATDFFDKPRFNERSQQVHRALSRDTEFGPDFVGSEAAPIA